MAKGEAREENENKKDNKPVPSCNNLDTYIKRIYSHDCASAGNGGSATGC